MLSDATLYSKHHSMQVRDTLHLLENVLPLMDWTGQPNDIVMDIGCGPGNTTRDLLLPAFPNVKSVVAIDVLPKMIDFAKKEASHPKISYYVANIDDRSTLENWREGISKVVSIYCFNWVKNHKTALENIYYLLKPGGEATVIFASSTPFWDSFPDLISNPKWSRYIKDVDPHIPECHYFENRSEHYRTMLENVGFSVAICKEDRRTFAYQNDEECKLAGVSRCALSQHIPEHLLEEFTEDVFQGFVKHNGRSDDGRPELQYFTLTFLIKKTLV